MKKQIASILILLFLTITSVFAQEEKAMSVEEPDSFNPNWGLRVKVILLFPN